MPNMLRNIYGEQRPLFTFYKHFSLAYICCLCVGIAYRYVTSGVEMLQLPILETNKDVFYLSTCFVKPKDNRLPLILEYGLLYIPFTIIVLVYILKRQKGKWISFVYFVNKKHYSYESSKTYTYRSYNNYV